MFRLRRTRQRLSTQQQAWVLDLELGKYTRDGWKVQTRSETNALLTKPVRFNLAEAFIWEIIFTGWIYLVMKWLDRDRALYLEVDEFSRVKRKRFFLTTQGWARFQTRSKEEGTVEGWLVLRQRPVLL